MKIIPKIREYNISLCYQRLITESLSVSERVEKVSEYIFDKIKNNFDGNNIVIDNIDFIEFMMINIDKINSDEYVDEGQISEGRLINGKINGIVMKLTILIDKKNRMINEDKVFSIVYHEVEHIYQSFLKLSNNKTNITTDLYNFALENESDKNSYIRNVSWIFYMSYTEEQDAYATGLFKKLFSNKKITKDNILSYYKETFEYEILSHLKDIAKDLPNWDINNYEYQEMVEILKENGIKFNLNDMILILNKAIKRFENKMGKVITNVLKRKRLIENTTLIVRRNLKLIK